MTERIVNAPNTISLLRLILSFVVFAMISLTDWWTTIAVLFVIAVSTDAVDGYLARKYQLITTFGRILDPLVDKVIVCGSFIFLQQIPESGICPWVSLAVILRELYITSLRGFFEQQGIDFSAKMIGKLKMVVQSAAIPVCLLSLEPELQSMGWFLILRDVLVWSTVAITVYSGVEYTFRGMKLYREKLAEEEQPESPASSST